MTNRIARILSSVLATFIVLPTAMAQEEVAKADDMRSQFESAAKQFLFSGGEDGKQPLTLHIKPILNWSNPERKTGSGALFLWTIKGRPAVAMGAYPDGEDGFIAEFQSLSIEQLVGKHNDETFWSPMQPGLEWKQVSASPSPSVTATRRLLQMRQIARNFSAKLVPPNRTQIPLRLLATPIYRYPERKDDGTVVDGTIFTFVQGTDPEVLLLIETEQRQGQELQWRYALARMSIVPTEVSYHEDLVWQTWWAIQNSATSYYTYKKIASGDWESHRIVP